MTIPVDVVLLTSRNPHQYALAYALARRYRLRAVVFEDVKSRRPTLLRRRMKKLGFLAVADQMAFKILDALIFQRQAARRRAEILPEGTDWDPLRLPGTEILEVPTLNDPETIARVTALSPQVLVVSGTGLIGKEFLRAVHPAPLVNIHAGITPRYRGTHGAFWAVVNGDRENIGTTVHYIDEGIDTGGILAQGTFRPKPHDDPRTLVLRQYRIGIDLVLGLVERLAQGPVETFRRDDLDSRLYSSPTLSGYLQYRKRINRGK
jgi:methionyl-tRNA formyltransferase